MFQGRNSLTWDPLQQGLTAIVLASSWAMFPVPHSLIEYEKQGGGYGVIGLRNLSSLFFIIDIETCQIL